MAQDHIIDKLNKQNNMSRFQSFTEREKKMLAEALWRRQRCFIAGDRMFKDYEELLNEVLEEIDYIPGKLL